MFKSKIIAMYLPQFHEISENNEWWGRGFTEWTNVKKAQPLFDGHYQPRVPYNYYDLSDIEVMKSQAELAQKYGINGFCFYHYWFNGRLMLEKPIENFLNSDELNFPYCLSWANEPWTRSWDGKTKDILIDQNYGDQSDWDNHFNYLMRFFKDKRYIKINNKPVILIYRSSSITCCDEMVARWDTLARGNGLDGIYVVETINSFQKNPCVQLSEAVMVFEPMYTLRHSMPVRINLKRILYKVGIIKAVEKLSYDLVWKKILKRKRQSSGKNIYLGGFVGWDNTPRKGKKGLIIDGSTPEKFKEYMGRLLTKANIEHSEFIFLNAWNEWGEGAHLEPDEKFGFRYLESVLESLESSEAR